MTDPRKSNTGTSTSIAGASQAPEAPVCEMADPQTSAASRHPPPRPLQPAQQSLPLPAALALVHAFSSFLAVAVHGLLYSRRLYPRETFLSRRAFNVAVHQSRHPDVVKWVQDAVEAVRDELLASGGGWGPAVVTGTEEDVDGYGNPLDEEGDARRRSGIKEVVLVIYRHLPGSASAELEPEDDEEEDEDDLDEDESMEDESGERQREDATVQVRSNGGVDAMEGIHYTHMVDELDDEDIYNASPRPQQAASSANTGRTPKKPVRHQHRATRGRMAPDMAVLERWVFDVSTFPRFPPWVRGSAAAASAAEKATLGSHHNTTANINPQNDGTSTSTSAPHMPGVPSNPLILPDGSAGSWADVNEAFRGMLVRLAHAGEKLTPIPGCCGDRIADGPGELSFTLALEYSRPPPKANKNRLVTGAGGYNGSQTTAAASEIVHEPPIRHPQVWIPSVRNLLRETPSSFGGTSGVGAPHDSSYPPPNRADTGVGVSSSAIRGGRQRQDEQDGGAQKSAASSESSSGSGSSGRGSKGEAMARPDKGKGVAPPPPPQSVPVARSGTGRGSTTPVRSVEAGPLFIECWVEEGPTKDRLVREERQRRSGKVDGSSTQGST